jgi:hypothetical protein
MKFITKSILLITVLLTQCFCQMGLFEAVSRDMDNYSIINEIGNKSSIFEDRNKNNKNKINNQKILPKKNSASLFETVGLNFNQVSEKIKDKNNNIVSKNKNSNQINSSLFSAFSDKNKEKIELNNKSIFSNSIKKMTIKNSENKIKNDKTKYISLKLDNPIQKNISNIKNSNISNRKNFEIIQAQQNNNIANVIKQLRYKTAALIELNSKLSSKLNKKIRLNKMNKKVSRNIVSFIQKNDERVTKIKTKIENKQNLIKSNLSNKEIQFNTTYQEANQKFSILQGKLLDLSKLFEEIMNKDHIHLSSIKDSLKLNNMRIKDKLDVDQNVFVDGKVISKNIDLASFRGDGKSLIFENPNTKLIIGNKIIHSKDLIKNLELIQKFNNKCGDNLKLCKILSREDLVKRAMNHGKVLEDLKGLRAQIERLSDSGKLN